MSKAIAMALFAIGAVTTNAYADSVESCPPVSSIKSEPATIESTPEGQKISAPYNQGFKYKAEFKGKEWTGETVATKDDFLAPEYKLKAKSFDGSICSYAGEKIVTKDLKGNDENSTPYLKLKLKSN